MQRRSPLGTRILESDYAVLVEGQDDERFFGKFLSHLGITACDVWDYNGKNQLPDSLMRISKDERVRGGTLRVLIVTIDADNDPDAALNSVAYHLNAFGFPSPSVRNTYSGGAPDVGAFLLGGNNGTGMLEDICLGTVSNHPAMPCVNTISACVMALDKDIQPKNRAKAEAHSFMAAHAFLAAQPKFVRHTGEAAEKGYWNSDSETLAELREFLLRLQHN